MVLGAASTALAVEPAGSPYAAIVARNVFGLKAPLPPPKPEDIKPPPPKITLQGFTTMLGTKLVLMKVVVPPAKPGSKTEEVPLTLSVGQKAEDVEVLEIHETEPAWVKVNDYGTITNLNFKDNGVNLASTAPPGVAPVAGPRRPGGVPPPGPAAPAPTIQPAKNWPPETPTAPEQAAIMEAAYTMKYQQQINAGTMPSVPGENPLMNNGSTVTQQKTRSGF